MKNTILKIQTKVLRLFGDNWRLANRDLRKLMKHPQTMCYLEIK